ncbi:hypothetical protein KC343_g1301 [Hortaea werneckii]|uniref:AA1-like domain-containing protein n=1 Tax=Hortaea werneckii TaxID=91943 RepID=A0A3M7EXE0_HORWE|nr:hypothetical protein KC338_g5430 [Hortaea werneckii]KAI7279422.1 hypothetical protein KC352_g7087 [Hortaea werneckii]KAI7570987.1 hypothetical protein KC317_g2008 [Hortaea werneckii]KAI7625464.1 hypothetical protein KC346_g1715 [Hortaea werneckii]KAI7636407.1 hypothetical protein KC343_g1301 [Hortaea werneckii]
MQLLTLTATLLALTPIATADFSLYKVGRGGTGLVGNVEGWQVYANTPDTIRCKSVRESLDWGLRPDVSGKKTGVRCKTEKGTCTRSRGGGEILEMELNERPIDGGANYHFTYYKDRGGALVGLNGEDLGHCTPDEGAQFFCSKGISRVEGTRKLNCKSSISASDLR